MRLRLYAFLMFVIAVLTVVAAPASAAGKLDVKFYYLPPGEEDPTYHLAIWLEDENGKYVKTLFVTAELSGAEYKMGNACPDWVKQANWEKADKTTAAAVTAGTPQVGLSALSFDLTGVAPGKYKVKLQVHVIREFNILFTGPVNVGGPAQEVKVETFYSPKKLEIGTEVVEDVQMNYVP